MAEPWKILELGRGVCLVARDETNRYFGDYHRVRLVVSVIWPLPESISAQQEELSVELLKVLEQMAVAGQDVERVRNELFDDFVRHARQYLLSDGFAERLWHKRQAEKRRPVSRY